MRFWIFIVALSLERSFASGGGDWNFRTQIVPILSKAGCNAGACHGAAAGQGGFHLSLLGYDPEFDYWSITREFAGRRVDLDEARESLVLRKPTRQVYHEGGRKLPANSEGYDTLLRWIEAGAPYGDDELRVTAITVSPADQLLPHTAEPVQLRVLAALSDSSTRDVTKLALYSSNDDAIAEVDAKGGVTMRGRGLTSIMVRFAGQVAAARVAVPHAAAPVSNRLAVENFIDEEIGAELARLGLEPAPVSADAEFLRRAWLDIAGRLPKWEETREWLASPRSVEDRQKLVDALLASEAFVDFWTLKFGDLLLISGKRGAEQATRAYHDWVREQIATNAPLNNVARALIGSEGDATRDGPVNFLTLANDPRDLSEYASDILLGTQIGCARCHAHPADRWTRDDYYEFAAFFAQIRRDGSTIGRNENVSIEYPNSKKTVHPKLLGAPKAAAADGDPRDVLADWIGQPDNPFFARAMVNRVWKHLLGRGLVEPVNDLRPTNPASHPRLLERLAEEFAANGFDLRWLIRTIAASQTYQLSSRGATEDRFYSRALLKPLPAQVFVDAVARVTGVPHEFEGAPEGTLATQLIGTGTPSYALDVLGRCARERACEPAGAGGGLAQALHLINGETVNARLGRGALAKMMTNGKSDAEIIQEFYLRALVRPPSTDELEFWEQTFASAADRQAVAEDFVWTLLNSREFAYNH